MNALHPLRLAAAVLAIQAAYAQAAPAPLAPPPAPVASAAAGERPAATAIVVTDQAALRAGPRDGARQQALLWQGEVVELRGERLDHVQVWDYQRERGGYLRAADVRVLPQGGAASAELLPLVRFLRDTPGAEAQGIGLAAAWLRAAPGPAVAGAEGAEVFDAVGQWAARLARRASAASELSKPAAARLAAHLDVAAGYGVRFASYDHDGRVQVCYDGEAFRRVLAVSRDAAARARAALALTDPDCIDPALTAPQRAQHDLWRAEVLDRAETGPLPAHLAHGVRMRRASVWSAIAFEQARSGASGRAAAERALAEFAGVARAELPDADQADYNDAAMRVGAVRWAVQPVTAPAADARLAVVAEPGDGGQTCVRLVDGRRPAGAEPLARRCTWGVAWLASARASREGHALALAVQPLAGWRELWVFRRQGNAWTVDVLPPAAAGPHLGYAEFAGWAPGGRQMLVAREAREPGTPAAPGRWRRSFELVNVDSLATERQAGEAQALGAFQRWQDAGWKRDSVALR